MEYEIIIQETVIRTKVVRVEWTPDSEVPLKQLVHNAAPTTPAASDTVTRRIVDLLDIETDREYMEPAGTIPYRPRWTWEDAQLLCKELPTEIHRRWRHLATAHLLARGWPSDQGIGSSDQNGVMMETLVPSGDFLRVIDDPEIYTKFRSLWLAKRAEIQARGVAP